MTVTTAFLSRHETFDRVGSTNDVVRDWLAGGVPEVCLAVAREQTAGRGRLGRTWIAPEGAGLLLSLGFRPTWLAPDRVWRLAAIASLAMAEAVEDVASLPIGTIRLKWPNDLVVIGDGTVRKVAGLLGETDGLGTDDPRAVVGIGLNTNWREADFPADLRGSMTSVRAIRDDRNVDVDDLLSAFVDRLERHTDDLHADRFEAEQWVERQVTTGRTVELIEHDGSSRVLPASGVDPATGALLVVDDRSERAVVVGEIAHIRVGRV